MQLLVRKKIWPVVVSISSALLMLLAFFIPSIQDQWDRYESRKIIQQYVSVGDDFVAEQNYRMAEQAFTRAFELSEERRLDIDVKRLTAKVDRIYQDPIWGTKPPEDIEEVDFQLLLHMKKNSEDVHERASIMTSYGIYLASLGRRKEAEKIINDAIHLNPKETLAYINMGNLLDEMGKKDQAAKAYQQAIALAPDNIRAHYNLGLLYSEQRKLKEAEKEFAKAIELDPLDTDAITQLDLVKQELDQVE